MITCFCVFLPPNSCILDDIFWNVWSSQISQVIIKAYLKSWPMLRTIMSMKMMVRVARPAEAGPDNGFSGFGDKSDQGGTLQQILGNLRRKIRLMKNFKKKTFLFRPQPRVQCVRLSGIILNSDYYIQYFQGSQKASVLARFDCGRVKMIVSYHLSVVEPTPVQASVQQWKAKVEKLFSQLPSSSSSSSFVPIWPFCSQWNWQNHHQWLSGTVLSSKPFLAPLFTTHFPSFVNNLLIIDLWLEILVSFSNSYSFSSALTWTSDNWASFPLSTVPSVWVSCSPPHPPAASQQSWKRRLAAPPMPALMPMPLMPVSGAASDAGSRLFLKLHHRPARPIRHLFFCLLFPPVSLAVCVCCCFFLSVLVCLLAPQAALYAMAH